MGADSTVLASSFWKPRMADRNSPHECTPFGNNRLAQKSVDYHTRPKFLRGRKCESPRSRCVKPKEVSFIPICRHNADFEGDTKDAISGVPFVTHFNVLWCFDL
jgi:hypothetical protein